MGNDQEYEEGVKFAMHILQDIMRENDDSVCFGQCDGKTVRQYVEDRGGGHALHELAISGVGDVSVIAADLIIGHFAAVQVHVRTVQHVLAELGLLQYTNQFAEFGIEYSMLQHLELPVEDGSRVWNGYRETE